MSNYYTEQRSCFIEIERLIHQAVIEEARVLKVDQMVYELTKLYQVSEKAIRKRVKDICRFTEGIEFDEINSLVKKK